MDGETSTRHDVDLLEHIVLDENAEPTYVPLSLLEYITNCFSDDHRIGSGGFAVVYKGIVGKGVVAVKKLSKTSDLPETKFHREIECLMKAKHKNIVRFLGYCSEVQGRIADYEGKFVMSDIRNWLLCFEYVPNGSLDKYITDASDGLEWRKRYEIIKGICEGLLHLHEKRILHLDLKPGNILIDEQMVPKITDFGLSMCLGKDESHAFTSNLCGSLGYFPPELFRGQQGHRGFASDIYSLGVIILEILTGEKWYLEDENVEQGKVPKDLELHSFQRWLKFFHRSPSKLDESVGGSDQRDTQLEQVTTCTKIGIECMDMDPKKRPTARHIIDMLANTPSTVETGISRSSAELEQQVSFLEEQHRKARRNFMRNSGPLFEKLKGVKNFNEREIKAILKDNKFISKDVFGEVYQGFDVDIPVAVRKPIGVTVAEDGQFAEEVVIQSQAIHKNIVMLIGCCLEVDIPVLVYEFVPQGSLHDILHSDNKVPVNLDVRLSIAAASSADALAYMQYKTRITILNGHVKT